MPETPEATTILLGGDVPGHEVPVVSFRQILVWPLSVDRRGAAKSAPDGIGPRVRPELVERAFVDTVTALLAAQTTADQAGARAGWRLIEDPLDDGRLDGLDDAALYGEFVYFHEFAQEILFGKVDRSALAAGRMDGTALVRFRNSDVVAVEVEWDRVLDWSESPPRRLAHHRLRLSVERCDLLLLREGLAFLVLEVARPEGGEDEMTVADVQDLVDRFRRAFPPYFETKAGDVYDRIPGDRAPLPAGRAARVPSGVRWITRNGAACDTHVPTGLAHDIEALIRTRNPVVAPHWVDLVPLPLTGQKAGASVPSPLNADDRPRWKAFSDERMPTMVSVQLPETWRKAATSGDELWTPRAMMRALERGDFIRLCFCDDRGSGLPYDPIFLANFEQDHCYRRFESRGTLFMATEYSFVHVLCSDFTDSLIHMRTMYCDMFLLAHIELVIHLSLSNRISVAIGRRDLRQMEASCGGSADAERQFQDEIIKIERSFLDAEQRYRFTGVTNQLQGGELFGMLRRKMRLDDLYGEMREELSTATSFILSANADRQADSAGRLNVFAVLGLVLGLAFSFLGMNAVMSEHFWNNITLAKSNQTTQLFSMPWLHLTLFFGTLTVCSGAAWGLVRWLVPVRDIDSSQSLPKLMRLLRAGALGSAAVTTFLIMILSFS